MQRVIIWQVNFDNPSACIVSNLDLVLQCYSAYLLRRLDLPWCWKDQHCNHSKGCERSSTWRLALTKWDIKYLSPVFLAELFRSLTSLVRLTALFPRHFYSLPSLVIIIARSARDVASQSCFTDVPEPLTPRSELYYQPRLTQWVFKAAAIPVCVMAIETAILWSLIAAKQPVLPHLGLSAVYWGMHLWSFVLPRIVCAPLFLLCGCLSHCLSNLMQQQWANFKHLLIMRCEICT